MCGPSLDLLLSTLSANRKSAMSAQFLSSQEYSHEEWSDGAVRQKYRCHFLFNICCWFLRIISVFFSLCCCCKLVVYLCMVKFLVVSVTFYDQSFLYNIQGILISMAGANFWPISSDSSLSIKSNLVILDFKFNWNVTRTELSVCENSSDTLVTLYVSDGFQDCIVCVSYWIIWIASLYYYVKSMVISL